MSFVRVLSIVICVTPKLLGFATPQWACLLFATLFVRTSTVQKAKDILAFCKTVSHKTYSLIFVDRFFFGVQAPLH